MSASFASPSLKKPGRPRSVTLDAVIDAACELGIDRIEMGAVAERLGVGVGTLYRYVKDRDHLVELVAAKRSRQDRIVDRGQSWQDVLREAAAIAYETFCATPELIGHIMSASIADETDARSTEPRLRLLVDRGFSPAEALSLLQQTQQIVAGAVVSESFKRAVEAKFGSYGGLVRHVAGTLGEDQFPLLSEAIRTGGDPANMGDYRPTLELVLAEHERRLAVKTGS
jgi:AcrR family transcriptional regulator